MRIRNIYLTYRQAEVLDAVKDFFIENSRVPNIHELAEHLGVAKSTSQSMLSLFCDYSILVRVKHGEYRMSKHPYRVIRFKSKYVKQKD